MTARQDFEDGRLAEAIGAQNEVVKARPTDADARYFLFVLLSFAGEFERASLQLDVIERSDAAFAPGVTLYRSLIRAEEQRRAVFAGSAEPLLPPDCSDRVQDGLAAIAALRDGNGAGAAEILEKAASAHVAQAGKLNGESFDDIRDDDDLVGPVLEIFAGGRYLWMPFDRIQTLEASAPERDVDLLWISAKLRDTTGNDASIHIPALYEGSHAAEDGRQQLGRMTDWIDRGGGVVRGIGQRVLVTVRGGETRETGILELRALEFVPGAADGAGNG